MGRAAPGKHCKKTGLSWWGSIREKPTIAAIKAVYPPT